MPGGAKTQARLGRYELLARLATGGMGEIFLARLSGAEGFEKLYVIKRILAHLADDARFRQMLIAEARIASKMSHQNICQVFELGETDGQLYIVMEYLEGVSLLSLLRRLSREGGQLDLGFIAGVIQQVTDAMNYAHELKDRDGENLGIIHRDVTPSNIFLTETGVAKVLDFGIAKAKGASTQTQEGTVKGKYAYMAPEQLKGGAIDRRADIFALGVVLYEMLALRRLFQRKTDYLTFRAVMEQPIPDIRRYRPDVPDGVAEALFRALDRAPANRYQTARQLGAAVLGGMPGVRPWTQSEVGDFVRAHFAGEIGKRSEQVASVVQRTAAGGPMSSRSTMPLLVHAGDGDSDGDEDDGFPSVETEIDGAPPWHSRPPTPPPDSPPAETPGNGAEFQSGGTPPPFGADPTGTMPVLRPLSPGAPTPTNGLLVVGGAKRSWFWPLFGGAMVVIAAGALILVWQQMQNQRPAEIKITQEAAARPSEGEHTVERTGAHSEASEPVEKVTLSPDPEPAAPGSGSAVTVTKKRDPSKPKTFEQLLNAAMTSRLGALRTCINQHRETLAKGRQILAAIAIDANGRAKSVSLSPGDIDSAPLGGCLKNVLMTTAFPPGRETSFQVPLTAKGG